MPYGLIAGDGILARKYGYEELIELLAMVIAKARNSKEKQIPYQNQNSTDISETKLRNIERP